jgi:hypothetical protein
VRAAGTARRAQGLAWTSRLVAVDCVPAILETVAGLAPGRRSSRACWAVHYQRLAPLISSIEGVDRVGELLQQAVEHEGNGSNGLRQAESTAKLALA